MAGKHLHYAVLGLLVQLASGCGRDAPANDVAAVRETPTPTAPAIATPIGDAKLVVAFGDSLYAGYNLPIESGFAPALERALAGKGLKARVFNAGVSGDTTEGGRQRLAFTLDGLPKKPDLVIVGLGGNDMLRGISPDVTQANLDAILAELKKRGLKTMLTGMLAAPNMGPDYAEAFNPIYPELAAKYHVPLYPFFLKGVIDRRDLKLPDGIHPNIQGIRLITERVAPLVEGALK